MTTLYAIQSQYRAILDRLEQSIQADTLTPDELEQLNQDLAINAAEFQDKADAYAAVIRQKQARAEFLRAEAARLTALAKAEDTQADRLMQRIAQAMSEQGLGKADTAHFSLSFRKSAAVEIADPDALPALYQRTKIVYEPDKVAIKAALQAGQSVAGASLTQRQSLQIK